MCVNAKVDIVVLGRYITVYVCMTAVFVLCHSVYIDAPLVKVVVNIGKQRTHTP